MAMLCLKKGKNYNRHFIRKTKKVLTASPIFLAIFESVIFAKGLSAPQHSTYFVIFDEGLALEGMPGVAS